MWAAVAKRGSSSIDWCENNYSITPVIAEFVNTLSNVLFLLLPPLLMWLFTGYARAVTRGVHVVWALLMVVGISSAYFHATLSMFGQLLDEISILWVIMAGVYLWFPRRFMPHIFQRNRKLFHSLVLLTTLLISILAFVKPIFNAFVLMTVGIPACVLLMVELAYCTDRRVWWLGIRCAITWVIAVSCWVTDRTNCTWWKDKMHFPYLHGAWHILIMLAAYTACVLFAYFDVVHEDRFNPHRNTLVPHLRFWPNEKFQLGVPYISMNCDGSYHHRQDVVFHVVPRTFLAFSSRNSITHSESTTKEAGEKSCYLQTVLEYFAAIR